MSYDVQLLCMDCVKEAGLVTNGTEMSIAEWKEHWGSENKWHIYLQYAEAGCMVCHKNHDELIATCTANLLVEEDDE